ncbi:MAG: hypothetical protein JWO95_1546 [Verrucomicrobiales bacterium]|nr:hypothetical protein [Verrucomicrobiales bacterium]
MNCADLIAGLEGEMSANTQWLRIHAAEGLLDNGESREKVAQLFRKESETATAPYRIGVWRVLARSTDGDERVRNIENIRAVLRDPQATDRISAAESLGKLNAVGRDDRAVIFQWLKTADDATAAFPRWLLVLSSTAEGRREDEAGLAALVCSNDAVARIRAAFALGRSKNPASDSIAKIREQLKVEPSDSIARIYLIAALLLHETEASAIAALEKQLLPYRNGKANEQLEFGIVTGLRGKPENIPLLEPLLKSREADARIGAANGLLQLLK